MLGCVLWMVAFGAVLAGSSAATLAKYDGDASSLWKLKNNGVSGETEQDVKDVDDYLETFGYYRHQQRHHQWSNLEPAHEETNTGAQHSKDRTLVHTEVERESALRSLQNFFHLRPSGHMNAETKKILSSRRCGVEDLPEYSDVYERSKVIIQIERVASQDGRWNRKKRYAVNKYRDGRVTKWRLYKLTWRVEIPSAQLSVADQKKTIRDSFAVWGRVIPIEFEEFTGDGEADIRIAFVRRQHGPKEDPIFDGRAAQHNTLAHAWGPSFNPKGFSGDVHFDEDDDWTNSSELFIVAVHEIGHSMGLLHSKDRSSLMYPIYQGVTTLSQDDLNGVDYLYGPGSDQAWKSSTRRPNRGSGGRHYTVRPEWVTRPPPSAVDTCTGVRVNAIFLDPTSQSRNTYIAFSGDSIHTLTSRGEVIQTEPLQSVFPELPGSPEIALSILKDQTIYFIKGESMWAYKNGALLEGFPRSIREMGFPEKPRFSISRQNSEGDDRPLLFGKNTWWSFDAFGRPPRSYEISLFSPDLPNDVMFVTQWSDKRLYAVTNDSYVVLDNQNRMATHNKPIRGMPDWLRELCENPSASSETSNFPQTSSLVLICLALLCLLVVGGIIAYTRFRPKH